MTTAEAETADEVQPEEIPKDTAGELERVKHIIASQFGIDMRSPGQVKQAELDGEQAEKELAEQQAKEEKEAAKAEAEAAKAAADAEKATKK